jgi:hypothetical protein
MVARLAGPQPIRLVEVSSLNVVSLMWWCAWRARVYKLAMPPCRRLPDNRVSPEHAGALGAGRVQSGTCHSEGGIDPAARLDRPGQQHHFVTAVPGWPSYPTGSIISRAKQPVSVSVVPMGCPASPQITLGAFGRSGGAG